MASFALPGAPPSDGANAVPITNEHALRVVAIIDACLLALNNPRAKSCSHPALCAWRGDKRMAEIIDRIKNVGEVICTSCTKLCVLALSSTDNPSILNSLYDELLDQVQVLVTFYIEIRDCQSASDHTVAIIMNTVRNLFSGVRELIHSIETILMPAAAKKEKKTTKNAENVDQLVRSSTGKVMATNKELKSLPVSNRHALRRSMLTFVCEVKDVVREYSDYITEARDAHAAGNTDGSSKGSVVKLSGRAVGGSAHDAEKDEGDKDEDEDDDDEEFESVPYTTEELEVVLKCVARMEVLEEIMKQLCTCMATVNDTIEPEVSDTPSRPVKTEDIKIMALDASIKETHTYKAEEVKPLLASMTITDIVQHSRHYTNVICQAMRTAPLVVEALGGELHTPFCASSIKQELASAASTCNRLVGYTMLLTDLLLAYITATEAGAVAASSQAENAAAPAVSAADAQEPAMQTSSRSLCGELLQEISNLEVKLQTQALSEVSI